MDKTFLCWCISVITLIGSYVFFEITNNFWVLMWGFFIFFQFLTVSNVFSSYKLKKLKKFSYNDCCIPRHFKRMFEIMLDGQERIPKIIVFPNAQKAPALLLNEIGFESDMESTEDRKKVG